jgi:hypothetical protein
LLLDLLAACDGRVEPREIGEAQDENWRNQGEFLGIISVTPT